MSVRKSSFFEDFDSEDVESGFKTPEKVKKTVEDYSLMDLLCVRGSENSEHVVSERGSPCFLSFKQMKTVDREVRCL